MEKEKDTMDKGRGYRRRRVDRLKTIMIIVAILMLILPTVVCLALFFKVKSLENKVNVIVEMNDKEYDKYAQQNTENGSVVHAAGVTNKEDKNKEDNNKEDEDKALENEEKDEEDIEATDKPVIDPDKKHVYLTFDDGPSTYTGDLLDLLDEYGIKVTFFTIGRTDEHSLEMYKEIVKRGHTLAMHSYSHDYGAIYASMDNFKADFEKIRNLLYETTGVKPWLYRFPGGSSNKVSKVDMQDLIKYLDSESTTYFDWNAVNGDATGKKYTQKELIQNVMDGVNMYQNSVVLMHDTAAKKSTLDSLPELIKELQDMDVQILPIDKTTEPVQHVKRKD